MTRNQPSFTGLLHRPSRRREAVGRAPLALTLALAALAHPTLGQAQTASLPPQSDISRLRLEPAPAPPGNDYRFTIENPEKSAVSRSVDEIEFSVKAIAVSGADHLDAAEVRAIFAPLEGRAIRLQQLREAADRLEAIYRGRGHFLARVFVPPQRVVDGVLEVRVVEGRIGDVEVDAPNPASEKIGRATVAPVIGLILPTLDQIEVPLLRLNDVPGIAATSVLRPGRTIGSTDMLLKVSRPDPSLVAAVTNTSSRELGPATYLVAATLPQPFGRPGSMDLFLSAAGERLHELQSAGLRLAMPVGNAGMVFSLGGLVARGHPGGLVGSLGIDSSLESVSARFGSTVRPDSRLSIRWDVGIALNRSRVNALGLRLNEDRSTVALLRLALEQRSWLGGELAVTLELARGIIALGADNARARAPSVAGFNPQFTRLVWSVRRVQRLTANLSATLEAQGQATGSTLVSGEQIGFGGPLIGRAFVPSAIVGDRGIGGIAEVQLSLPRLARGPLGAVSTYAFADWAKTVQSRTGEAASLGSLGAGLRFSLFRHTTIDLQLAHALSGLSPVGSGRTRLNVNAMLRF